MEILVGVLHLHDLAHAVAHRLLEVLLDLLLYNEDHLLKSSSLRVVHGEIHDNVSLIVHRVNLLESAVAASHSCRHDH